MKVLNRQSDLYQHFYRDALMRLARVPQLFDLKPIKGIDFLTYPTKVLGYVFNRDELELPTPSEHVNHADMAAYLSERVRDVLMRSYGTNTRASLTVPLSVSWPMVLLSVLSEMRRSIGSNRDYIDIEQTAHYAVMRYTFQVNRILNRSGGEDRPKVDRLTLDQAMMELIAGNQPELTRPFPGLETKLTVGLVGTNQLTWGLQSRYNGTESIVSYLNGLSVETWDKVIAKLTQEDQRPTICFYVNGPWGANRLPVEGEAFIDSYGVPAIATIFGQLVDSYYRTDEAMSPERAMEIIRVYSEENDTKLPTAQIFRDLHDGFRSKWLALEVVDPLVLRDIAQEAFDECFELIRAVRVVRQYLVD